MEYHCAVLPITAEDQNCTGPQRGHMSKVKETNLERLHSEWCLMYTFFCDKEASPMEDTSLFGRDRGGGRLSLPKDNLGVCLGL